MRGFLWRRTAVREGVEDAVRKSGSCPIARQLGVVCACRHAWASPEHIFAGPTVSSHTESTATPTASVLCAATSKPKGRVTEMFTDVARSWHISCSKQTQATVTTGTIGTQCTLGALISSSCQTYEEFPGFGVDGAGAGTSWVARFPVPRGGIDMPEAVPHTFSCGTQSGSTGCLSSGSEAVQFRGKLYSYLSRQQRNDETAHVEVGTSDIGSYVCPLCKKVFRDKDGLVKHERYHSGHRSYMCGICQQLFFHKSTLDAHERAHSGEKPFMCSICQKCFTRKNYLVKHEISHSGEKPYVCNICQKSFLLKHGLIRHQEVHTGEESQTCDICQKSFSSKRALAQHRRLHSNENPHACNICQKSFVWKANLIKHERSHTAEGP